MADDFGGGRFNETTKRIYQTAKVGATSGWVVNGAADTFMSTLPQSQTNSTLVMPLTGLEVGDKIVGVHLEGQIDSAGNAATIKHQLYEFDPQAAGSVASALSGTLSNTLSVTADTELSETNTKKSYADANQVTVKAGRTYFLLITATTGGTTDQELLGAVLHMKKRG